MTVYRLAPNITCRSLGDGAVIMFTDSGQLFTCNETTESFLSKVDGIRAFEAIVAALADEYEVEAEVLAADMAELAADLVAQKIIVAA